MREGRKRDSVCQCSVLGFCSPPALEERERISRKVTLSAHLLHFGPFGMPLFLRPQVRQEKIRKRVFLAVENLTGAESRSVQAALVEDPQVKARWQSGRIRLRGP